MKNKILTIFTNIEDDNLAYHVAEDDHSVDLARDALAKKYKFDNSNLKFMEQIHSNIVKTVSPDTNVQTCDALITNQIDTPLMVMVADCIPILFYDHTKKVIGAAHAGRAGTFENISGNTVNKMIEIYHCNPKDIEVVLGPSIEKCCYEVSEKLASQTATLFGEEYVNERNIDLQGINKKQLLEVGVKETNITTEQICTKCSNEPYFSYRKDKHCGRFAGVIMMKSKQKTSP
ncbi:peptidoglycan editing factor PgeF [Arcobacteraceae bacterium]|nr:peptidoglycan editing factor PgeF [Arcobacteraceae bacterium]